MFALALGGRDRLRAVGSRGREVAGALRAALLCLLTLAAVFAAAAPGRAWAGSPYEVTRVAPPAGGAGAHVYIDGVYPVSLAGVTAVRFGDVETTNFRVNFNEIDVIAPPHALGTVDITLVSPEGVTAVNENSKFTYVPGPILTGVSPSSGPSYGGDAVTLTGTNFGTSPAVYFGNQQVRTWTGPPTGVGGTQVTVFAPPGGAGTVDITVVTAAGTSPITAAGRYTYVDKPRVTALTPSYGPSTGGNVVAIRGSGFKAGATVMFGQSPATNVSVDYSDEILATAPPGVVGTVDVVVTTSEGVSDISANDHYTYVGAPTVSAVSSVVSTAGGTINILGTEFLPGSSVSIAGVAATDVNVAARTLIIVTVPPRPAGTSGHITVTTAAGTSAATAADVITYVGAPTITALTPNAGPNNSTMVITGSNFTGAYGVWFGDSPASMTINSDTQITVITASINSPANVVVKGPGGTSATSAATLFTPLFAPGVTGLSIHQGLRAGGNTVVITGSGFSNATGVKFGGVDATFTVNSDTQITATSPSIPNLQTYTVKVTVLNGGGSSNNFDTAADFTYVPPQNVGSVTPSSGPTSGGTSVVIAADGTASVTDVRFGSVSATSFTKTDATHITAVSPPGAAGQVYVTLINVGGASSASANAAFTYSDGPTVSSISPASGLSAGGARITVTGSHFTGATSVKFGSASGTAVSILSDTQLQVTSPPGTGSQHVTVTGPSGTSPTGSSDVFSYTDGPIITGLSPTYGPSVGGTAITIFGSNFSGATAVKFGTVNATSFVVTSPTSVNAVAPPGSGPVDVHVTTSKGTSSLDLNFPLSTRFTYLNLPIVSAVSPATGPASGGGVVTITGTGFTGATRVLFGFNDATSFTIVSNTQITATAPPGVGGVFDVTVVNNQGSSPTTSADLYTYVAGPQVSGISPAKGATAGGTTVQIDGGGFTGATSVKFGAVAASFNVVSATRITATAPAGAAGPAHITVTTGAGTSPATGSDLFTYGNAPSVSGLSPSVGPLAGGTSVTVGGVGFTGATAVRFGEVPAASFTVNSNTQITAIAPPGAIGFVDVTVTTPGGVSDVTTADRYTYANAPVVTGVTPANGTSGTIQILGTGLSNPISVTFGATRATVLGSGDTGIAVTLPPGVNGQTVDVRVTTVAGISPITAADHFTYNTLPVITEVTPGATPGTQVIIRGQNLGNVTSVKFGTLPATVTNNTFDNQVWAIAPDGPIGQTVDIVVTNAQGSTVANPYTKFTFQGPVSATGISPATGPAAGGTSVVITGSGFYASSIVKFGATPAASVTVNSPTQITAIAPAGFGQDYVTVTTPMGTTPTDPGMLFTWTASSGVSGVSPGIGPPAGGTTVTITGAGFTNASTVKFGNTPAAGVTFVDSGHLTAVSPPGAVGAAHVTVTTAGFTTAAIPADVFNYGLIPTVTAMTPIHGPVAGGGTIVVTGTGFTNASKVSFGDTAATSFTVNSDTQITAVVPKVNYGQQVNLRVQTPIGLSTSDAPYTYDAAPQVFSMTPATGPSTGGTTVTINGAFLTGTTSVKFGGVEATSFTVVSAGQITAVTPGASGGGGSPVTVTNVAGTNISQPDFIYFAPLSGMTPTTPADVYLGSNSYVQALTMTGGAAPFYYTITSGALPPGMTLVASPYNPRQALLLGPSSAAGVFTFTIQAADSSGHSLRQTFTLTVRTPTLTITPASLPATVAGTPYNQTLTATGGTGPYSFAVTGGALPAGLTLNGATGVISGTPARSEAVVARITVTDAVAAKGIRIYGGAPDGGVPVPTPGPAIQLSALQGRPVSADLTAQATGGPFTGAAVVSVSPANAGVAAIVQTGSGAGAGYGLSFTSSGHFSGNAVITYTISNASGASAPATVTVAVAARPDPSLDAGVTGVISSQTDAAISLAETQASNFSQRLESLHGGPPPRFHNGVTFGFGFADQNASDAWLRQQADRDRLFDFQPVGHMSFGPRDDQAAAAPSGSASAAPGAGPSAASQPVGPGQLALWTAGSIRFGRRDAGSSGPKFDFSSGGLSFGVDSRLSDQWVLGAGGGYGQSTAKFAGGSRVDARDGFAVIYGGYRPGAGAFLDGLVGYGRLDFDSRRAVPPSALLPGGGLATGSRAGDQVLVSLTGGWDWRGGDLSLSPYGRLTSISGRLDGFTETGAGLANLTYARQDFSSLKVMVGFRAEQAFPGPKGVWAPRVRLEYQRELKAGGRALVSYADWTGGPSYGIAGQPFDRDRLLFGLGVAYRHGGQTYSLDYDGGVSSGQDYDSALTGKISILF